MRTFAVELGSRSIRVNTIHPTHVNTPLLMNDTTYRMFRPELENPGPEDLKPVCQSFHFLPIPWVEPEDISNAVLFLASDEARYITGMTLPGRRRQPASSDRRSWSPDRHGQSSGQSAAVERVDRHPVVDSRREGRDEQVVAAVHEPRVIELVG